MSLSLLWSAGLVLQLLRLAKLHGAGRRALCLAAAGSSLGRPDLHHLSAAVPARVHVLASPHLPPLLQRRPRPEPHARLVSSFLAAVALVTGETEGNQPHRLARFFGVHSVKLFCRLAIVAA